jgi:hypothetical protein
MADSNFGDKGYFAGTSAGDVENGNQTHRKMSRIDGGRNRASISGSIAGKSASSPDVDDENPQSYLDAQRDAESGNEIQYRTCSWQKVRRAFLSAHILPIPLCLFHQSPDNFLHRFWS